MILINLIIKTLNYSKQQLTQLNLLVILKTILIDDFTHIYIAVIFVPYTQALIFHI
ncbi:protein of unknown function [Moritella yayanosii]|uniref:Uncharacterized protein n=1 Tax=Moritella yayanosii TaxID=69539 RepID=A0A330LQT4_9GAMM|nr:protein of unknown function [Moritella yayanosii]